MVFKNIAVIGAGTMGAGIAQVCAQIGCSVNLYDISKEALETAVQGIEKSLQKGVDRKKIDIVQMQLAMGRIQVTTNLQDAVKDADLVIEAIIEDLMKKLELFKSLDEYTPPSAVFASNTSALPISAMAAATKRPTQVLGLHFMNPVPLMKGVEVISAIDTSKEVLDAGIQFVRDLGKEPVQAVDYAGFIVSRILDAMLNEAVYCVMDGNNPVEVDKAMKICTNFPMGPCELIDLAGADIVHRGLNTLEEEFGDRFHPAPLLVKMVRAGHYGRKSGRGFYEYKDSGGSGGNG